MSIFKAEFTDYDHYQEFTQNWDVDFRVLSKTNFYVYLNMYLSDTIQLSKTSLNGKIDQYGLSPKGFRSIVIPNLKNGSFNWLGKNVTNNQLLIFPKNRNLDAVSFDGFEIFILDIKEEYLFLLLEKLALNKALLVFEGNQHIFHLDQRFALTFLQNAEKFLQRAMIQQSKGIENNQLHLFLLDNLVTPLLKYINIDYSTNSKPKKRKRDKALSDAIEIINFQTELTPSISELCSLTNVSERTLEYAFLERFQVSPSEYIKATKLHKIRNELTVAKEQNLDISTVANKYGFWHSGQFALDFKTQFGVLPSSIFNKY
ncbi:helix-turn-helix domain-containing protein [Flavicella marina]|uniref:helix-turn-helix domain-containing protein n=1 Tax=Flavicella marina TaxID=1475951 RepID=UPI0012641C2E|nr:helix-turn-helix domain-containing protein [Flavicella marina]